MAFVTILFYNLEDGLPSDDKVPVHSRRYHPGALPGTDKNRNLHMAKRFSNWLIRISSGRVTLIALGIFLLFTALVLPGQSRQEPGGEGTGSPDLSFYYTGADLFRMAESYGEEGREAYVHQRFTFDLAWPLVYTFFLVTSISWLAQRGFESSTPWQAANLVPIFALLFDLLENLSTSLVMIYYPRLLTVLAGAAGFFTLVKWTLVGGSFILLLACAAAAAWQGRKVRVRT